MNKLKQAFIFAAGQGTRMRPLTNNIPKPLIKIKNKPIIDYIIDNLNNFSEIEKIIINGFYLSEQIADHLKNLDNSKIIFSKEEIKLETGGGLLYALQNNRFDENQPIILLNGDIIWFDDNKNSDIEKLKEYYFKLDCDIILGLTKTKNYFGYNGQGDFNLIKEHNEIEKSEHNNEFSFVGLQIINPKILKYAPQQYFSMSYFYQNYKKLNIKLKAIELNSQFFHIGDVKAKEDFENFNK